MFQIKICGITRPEDAQGAAEAGADAIGLNFYPPSPRSVDFAAARAIVSGLPASVATVGVFVNETIERVTSVCEVLGLDFVQLHGDEPPRFLAQLHGRRIVRAFRLTAAGWPPILDYLAACRELNSLPDALLIDAFQPGQFGGTGLTLDWQAVANRPAAVDALGLPILLAGGLTPDNVAQAIASAQPWGVDTASGVEASAGIKDPAKIQAFVANARQALRKT